MIQNDFLPEGLNEEMLAAYIEGTLDPAQESIVADLLDAWDGAAEFISDIAHDLAEGPLTDDSVTFIDDADLDGFELPELPGDSADHAENDDTDNDAEHDVMDLSDDCHDDHDDHHGDHHGDEFDQHDAADMHDFGEI